jgi:hypothetical protein
MAHFICDSVCILICFFMHVLSMVFQLVAGLENWQALILLIWTSQQTSIYMDCRLLILVDDAKPVRRRERLDHQSRAHEWPGRRAFGDAESPRAKHLRLVLRPARTPPLEPMLYYHKVESISLASGCDPSNIFNIKCFGIIINNAYSSFMNW